MAKVNLLPWREDRRQERKKQFVTVLGGVLLLGVLLVLLGDRWVTSSINDQRGRNQHLSKNIAELNRQVAEIKDLDKKRQELIDRMQIIQQLQGNRPIIVRIFDELVRTMPDGVFYTGLNRSQNLILATGTAESNNRVSSLMRRLDESEWFADPNLTEVKANPEFGEQASNFKMSISITTPASGKEE